MNLSQPHNIQALLRQLDKWAIIVAIGAIIVLSVAYFVLGSFSLSPGSIWDMARQFSMSLITNLIPVFLLFAITYALFLQPQQIKSEQEIESLVGKICEAISSNLEGIRSELKEQRGLLEQNLGGQPLEKEEIYPAVTRIIGIANQRIRIILLESRPSPPDEVLDAIAERLHIKKVRYDLVMVLGRNSVDLGRYEDTHKKLVQRLESLSHEATEHYMLWVLETEKTICFDTIIIDKKHIGIGFTQFPPGKDVQNAIMFKNHPELAEKFADWFDNMIVPQSKRYKEWIESRRSVGNKLDT